MAHASGGHSIRSNSPAVTPEIHGPTLVAIHINSKIEGHHWSFVVREIPARGEPTNDGELVGPEYVFGGGQDPRVRDALLKLPLYPSDHYRLVIYAVDGGGKVGGTDIADNVEMLSNNDGHIYRFLASFRDQTGEVGTWFDIHFKYL
jgi:hypothetical protein